MRTYRFLIQIISAFQTDVIHEVSPYASKTMKPICKLPMIFAMSVDGMMCGISVVFWKFLGELAENGDLGTEPFLLIILLCGALASCPFMLFALNWAQQYYDQLDVMPTYFAQILVWTLLCGLIILDEGS